MFVYLFTREALEKSRTLRSNYPKWLRLLNTESCAWSRWVLGVGKLVRGLREHCDAAPLGPGVKILSQQQQCASDYHLWVCTPDIAAATDSRAASYLALANPLIVRV